MQAELANGSADKEVRQDTSGHDRAVDKPSCQNDIIDFSFIYSGAENLYCTNNGRPSIDPVVLTRYLFTGFLYGTNSERRISQEIQVNIFEEAARKNHEKDGSERHTKVLLLRQIWSEGSFAAQKAGHNLKFIYRRGLEAAEQQCLLSSTALNLKRMIKAML